MDLKRTVLIVDDRQENLLVLESLLEDWPLNLLKANSGDEALKHLLKEEVDLIFLDVRMPGMNGFETARLIRGKHKTRDIPIVFISGVVEKEYDALKKEYPDNLEHMTKPIDVDKIQHYINKFLPAKVK